MEYLPHVAALVAVALSVHAIIVSRIAAQSGQPGAVRSVRSNVDDLDHKHRRMEARLQVLEEQLSALEQRVAEAELALETGEARAEQVGAIHARLHALNARVARLGRPTRPTQAAEASFRRFEESGHPRVVDAPGRRPTDQVGPEGSG